MASHSSKPDETGGERDRVIELVRKNVFQYVSRKHANGAEDITQDTMLVLQERYAHVTGAKDLVPLAITIAKNKIHEFLRREVKAGSQLPEGFDAVDSSRVSIELELIHRGAAERFWKSFRQLGEDCQKLLRMLMAGKKTDEMRRILGIGESAYFTRLCRCRQRLSLIMGWAA